MNSERCDECNGDTKVFNSRPMDNGWRMRRRECLKCGKRYTTYEIRDMEVSLMQASQKAAYLEEEEPPLSEEMIREADSDMIRPEDLGATLREMLSD